MSENTTKIEEEEMEISISDLFKSITSRLWIVILCFLVCVAAAVAYLIVTTPVYESSNTMMVSALSDSSSLDKIFDLQMGTSNSKINNEIELFNSRLTFLNALKKLDLSDYHTDEGIAYSDLEHPLTYEGLRKSVTVETVKDTQIVKVTVKNTDKAFATDFCNALAESFAEVLTGMTRDSASHQLQFIEAQIPVAEENLRKATMELSEFQRENSLMQMTEKGEQLLAKMSYYTLVQDPLSLEMDDSRKTLNAFALLYPEMKVSEDTLVEDEFIKAAIGDLTDYYNEMLLYDVLQSSAKGQISLLSANQTERYFALTNMNASLLADLHHYIAEKAEAVLDPTLALEWSKAFVNILLGEEKLEVLSEKLEEVDVELAKIPDIQRQLLELQSEVEITKALVLKLRQMQSETALLEASLTTNVNVIDEALVPLKPVSPSKAKTLLLAGMLGIIMGCGICVVLGLTDKRIKNRDDLEGTIGTIPVLGWIPVALKKPEVDESGRSGIVLSRDPMCLMSERYKQIASSIVYGKRLGSNLFTVCSVGKSDGKTVTLANLAYALALNGKKVLVVDLDLRMPNVENTFEVKHNPKGIVDVLAGECDPSEAIEVPYSHLPNLHIMGTGKNVLVPSMVIQNDSLSSFIDIVQPHYDYIIIDAPPLSYASELLTIARVAPEILIVTRAGISTKPELRQLIKDLESCSSRILGVCLNGLALDATSLMKSGLSSGYGYSYGYGYGKDSKDTEKLKANYLKSSKGYKKVYRKQVRRRGHVSEFADRWPVAQLAYDKPLESQDYADFSSKVKPEPISISELTKSVEDYLADIESDTDARGKKD